MPQSLSPSSTNSKAGSDDNNNNNTTTRMSHSEAALRKKKNADAQAAFRARRANYIATLEETVTNLEAVVIQLQDSCKDAKNDAAELRAENARLRLAHRERERFWRALWQAKNTGQPPPDAPGDDYSIPSYSPVHTPISAVGPSLQYPDDGMRMPPSVDPSTSLAATTSYVSAPQQDYSQRAQMTGFEHDASGDARSQHMDPQRMQRYDPYSHYAAMESPVRDAWPTNELASMEGADPNSSPTYIESPSLTAAEANYGPRFSISEDQKLPLTPLTPSYMYPGSRSLSPASTPTSTSSSSAVMPFQYSYAEGTIVQDRAEFPYRRQGSNHGPELTLHGGTANIPIAGPSGETLRYRIGGRNGPPGPSISPYSRAENGSHDRESDDGGDPAPYHYTTRTRHRHSAATSRTSRSPSPDSPQICGTLAVIKAQAFGALRRTRTRSKRSSEGAAKAAVEALEARGIGLGISSGSKRPRSHVDASDMQL
ncbi:unnamed protein product [Somion occarium]|uniref:BZIP domain-containing protein n=1 Tax=Somion occarium TaxID=3059160 RepID=A0ABP1CMD7_9APHY